MILGPLFDQFIARSPLSVMARATLERVLRASDLDDLYRSAPGRGYERNLLFSTLVELMSLISCSTATTVKSAYQRMRERVPVTLKSVYEKLQNLDSSVSSLLVGHVARRSRELIDELGGGCRVPLAGYRTRIVDGNYLAARQKRLKVTRGQAAPLPGLSLAVLDPERMLITDLIQCEDGHAQERSLIEQLLPMIHAKDLWIADRNFCTTDLLVTLAERGASFVIRHHKVMTIEPQAQFGQEVETDTGWVSEAPAWVCRDKQQQLMVRLVRVRLKELTQDKDAEIFVLSNLPKEDADAVAVAKLYQSRWKVEGAFHELTMSLNCEVRTLGYPKAALFAFAVAVTAYNVLAVIKAAMRTVHGEVKVKDEVSTFYIGLELAAIYAGMMILLPTEDWEQFGVMSVKELAALLREWASKIDMRKIKKSPPRRPTKVKTKRIEDGNRHVSTARLLAEEKAKQRAARKSSTKSKTP